MNILLNLSREPGACVLLMVLLFLFSFLLVFLLMESLLKMHRSKTAVKQIKKEYSLFQNIIQLPLEKHGLHASRFCKGFIRFHRIGMGGFAAYLLVALGNGLGLISDAFLAWSSAGMFLLYEMPVFVLNGILSRPFIGRFREYSFQKYHNTENHDQLL